ncbi:MAG: DUF975 family protein [Peptostreptococcaceae bacterium]
MGFSHLKGVSKIQLKGNVGKSFILLLGYMVIVAILQTLVLMPQSESGYLLVSLLVSLCTNVLGFGINVYFLKMARGENFSFQSLIYGFNSVERFFKIIIITILMGLAITFGFMLFIIPGIIITFSLSQAVYILIDNKDMSPVQCLQESARIMKGNKMDFFMLHVSFIGWAILYVITFGLAGIYVVPYYNLCCINFYEEIK